MYWLVQDTEELLTQLRTELNVSDGVHLVSIWPAEHKPQSIAVHAYTSNALYLPIHGDQTSTFIPWCAHDLLYDAMQQLSTQVEQSPDVLALR